MIKLTKIDGQVIALNEDFIDFIAATPDTIITTQDAKSYVVKESLDDILDKIVQYKKDINKKEN